MGYRRLNGPILSIDERRSNNDQQNEQNNDQSKATAMAVASATVSTIAQCIHLLMT